MKILNNGVAVIENDSHISRWVEETGRLDHDQNALPSILKYIRRGDTVVDVGALIGDHTIAYARKVGHIGRVIAFEPNAPAFECLHYNMRDFDNVSCHQVGLSDAAAHASVVADVNAGASHLVEGVVGVITTTLDSYQFDIDFMKIDVEGWELKVLRGAAKTIERCKPVMYIEVNEGALNRQGTTGKQLLEWIVSAGYVVDGIQEGPQFDVFCFPHHYVK